ncbi:ficolin-1-like isoform X2 [Drosophila novamexicana]|uniref:ficolin-1-like isoform X2 n=1 Tax=Drosophila novamexicana TaxID=47314 RepID=UPI0011E5E9EE|nr:ficolin-1-like isoform X2 [Drosophila novamexicana]
MHNALLLALVGFLLGAANAQWPTNQISVQVQNVKQINAKLQEKLNELQIKVAENRYKDELIKSLKETNEGLTNKCSTACTGVSAVQLKGKISELKVIVETYKQMLNNNETSRVNVAQQQLKTCLTQLGQNSPGSGASSTPQPIEKPPAAATSCLPMGYRSGLQTIQLPGLEPITVLCDGSIAGPGWTVIQRRFDGSVDFYRSWQEYIVGFGQKNSEFFIGLENLYRMISYQPHELYIHMEDFNGKTSYARYNHFEIGNEVAKFELRKLGSMSGSADDKLSKSVHMKFSTFDQDNDNAADQNNAAYYHGAWWYTKDLAGSSNLNGKYFNYETENYQGMYWNRDRTLKSVTMLVRPINYT